MKTLAIALATILIIFMGFIFNSAYYMYHIKETFAIITDIEEENNFTLFLPVGRYALTLISNEQHVHTQKIISGEIFFNGTQLSAFHVNINDVNIDRAISDSYFSNQRPKNLLYPETHNIPGYYQIEKIGVINVEDHNHCTLKIMFDSRPENILLKIETYMRK